MPTRYNSDIYRDSTQSAVDAATVTVLRAAGALILGKTATTEFAATTVGGPCRNPHHPEHTPGGSSSGSAAAVADFQVPLALGTQTGGSTIRPASYNGIYGFKVCIWNILPYPLCFSNIYLANTMTANLGRHLSRRPVPVFHHLRHARLLCAHCRGPRSAGGRVPASRRRASSRVTIHGQWRPNRVC